MQPRWPQVYLGEALTLRCEIQGGEAFEWEYNWHVPSTNLYDVKTQDQYRISYATGTHAGDYSCSGRMKNYMVETKWSAPLRLTAYNSKSCSHTHVSDICLKKKSGPFCPSACS